MISTKDIKQSYPMFYSFGIITEGMEKCASYIVFPISFFDKCDISYTKISEKPVNIEE